MCPVCEYIESIPVVTWEYMLIHITTDDFRDHVTNCICVCTDLLLLHSAYVDQEKYIIRMLRIADENVGK